MVVEQTFCCLGILLGRSVWSIWCSLTPPSCFNRYRFELFIKPAVFSELLIIPSNVFKSKHFRDSWSDLFLPFLLTPSWLSRIVVGFLVTFVFGQSRIGPQNKSHSCFSCYLMNCTWIQLFLFQTGFSAEVKRSPPWKMQAFQKAV